MERLLLTEEDLAEMFGVQPSTVRSWKNRNKIPKEAIFKISEGKKSTVRFIASKIKDWIEHGGLQT